MTKSKRPQQKYNFPPPNDAWWETKKGRMIRLLWDLKWHTQGECLAASGHRFGGVVGVLRIDGWDIETRKMSTDNESFEYRLLSHTKGPELEKRKRLYLSVEATKALAGGTITDEAMAVAAEALERV